MGLVFEIFETLKSKKLATSKIEPFWIIFNCLQESAIVISFPGSASIFSSHFLYFSRDLHNVHWVIEEILNVYNERRLVDSLWTIGRTKKNQIKCFKKQNRRNSSEKCNAKQTNAFYFMIKSNLESEAYSEPSRVSAMELFCENL